MTLNVNAPDFVLPNSLQAIYDHVAAHLLRQGRPALAPSSEQEDLIARGETICRYHGARGTRCAIGCLIPNGRYSDEMEGRWGPAVLADLGILPRAEIDEYDVSKAPRVRLLSALQMLHDDAAAWPDDQIVARWEKGLADLAREFGLRPFTRDMLSNNKE